MNMSQLSLQGRIHLQENSSSDAAGGGNKFDRAVTTIHYNKNNEMKDDVKIVINSESHKGRSEDIKVFIGGELQFFKNADAQHILNMGNCFKEFPEMAMEHLTRICSKNGNKESTILPFVEYRTPSDLMSESANRRFSEKLQSDISSSLEKNPNLKQILVPVKDGGHWRFCILSKCDDETWRLIAGDTTSSARAMPLSGIEANYKGIQGLVLDGAKKTLPCRENDTFHYMEFKQYGERGCGITASIVMEGILKGEIVVDDSKLYKEGDWSVSKAEIDVNTIAAYNEQIVTLQSHMMEVIEDLCDGKIDQASHDEQLDQLAKQSEEIGMNIRIAEAAGEQEVYTLTENRSESSNLTLEALRRVQLAFKIEKSS